MWGPDYEATCAFDASTTGTLRVEVTALVSGDTHTFERSAGVGRDAALDPYCQ